MPAAAPAEPLSITIPREQDGARLDAALAALSGTSSHAIKRLCALECITRSGRVVRKGDRVRAGETYLLAPLPASDAVPPSLTIRYETPRYVVVDKPAGLPSHKLRPQDPPSALECVVAPFPTVATAGPDPREGGLLHRLDVNTSGALALARDPEAYEVGRAAFRDGTARKLYLALTHGTLPDAGTVEVPVAHDPADPRRSVVVLPGAPHRGDGRAAATHHRVLRREGPFALVLLDAQGGRRHQVRVHMAHAGAPLCGDDLYGGPAWPNAELPGHALHAVWLRFPSAEGVTQCTVEPPQAFVDAAVGLLGPGVKDVLRNALGAPDKLIRR